jgi:hypothetical protein
MFCRRVSMKFAEKIKQQAKEIEDQGLGGTSPLMEEMIAYWQENRPKMHKRLRSQGILTQFAMVQENEYQTLVRKAIQQGVNGSDAARMYQDELIMEPESDEETTT